MKKGELQMIFVILLIAVVVVFFIYLSRLADNFRFSKSILVLSLFSIVANTSLAQNFNQSLIRGANDGIGISNKIAYWIITDDNWGQTWSVELFKNFYEISLTVLILVVIMFVASIAIETRFNGSSN